MEGLAQEALAFLEGFAVTHAVALGAIVTALITGHGVGKAVGNLIVQFAEAIASRLNPGGENGG